MIENTAVLKIVGGIGTIGAAGGIGAYGYNKGWFNYNSDVFLVVKATAAKAGTGADALFTNEVKNYQCKFAENTTDNASKHKLEKDCEVFDIGDSTKFFDSTSKKIKFDEILNSNTKTTSEITNAHYYKIKIKSSLLSSIKIDSASSIELIKTDETTGTTANKFGTLKTLFWIDSNKEPVSKTQFLLVKAKEPESGNKTASKSNSKCSFGTKTTPYECEIWKFTTQPTDTNAQFAALQKNTSNGNVAAITNNNFYLIQFTKQLDLNTNSNLIKEEITYTEWNSATPSAKTDGKLVQSFTFVSALVGEEGNNNAAPTALHRI